MAAPDTILAQLWPDSGDITAVTYVDVDGEQCWNVGGDQGVTRIEKTYKSGEYSHIPYVRVWHGDKVAAEHCQHKLTGVFFKVSP